MIMRQNIIKKNPVMVEDIDIAEKVFVTYVYTLKGIIIRQRPKLVVDNFIEIPREIIENNQ